MMTGGAERAIVPGPDQPRPHWLPVEILQLEGQPEEAWKPVQEAFVIGRSDADSLANFGGFLRLDGRPKEAIKVSQPTVCLDPMPPIVSRSDRSCLLSRWSVRTGDRDPQIGNPTHPGLHRLLSVSGCELRRVWLVGVSEGVCGPCARDRSQFYVDGF